MGSETNDAWLSDESAFSAIQTDEEAEEDDEFLEFALEFELRRDVLKSTETFDEIPSVTSSVPLLEHGSAGSWKSFGVLERNELYTEKSFSVFQPAEKCILPFPRPLENFFRPLDDFFISITQFTSNKILAWICDLITLCTAIEIIFMVPFALLALGIDGLGSEMVYLGLTTAVISQIPKRFIWRYRPWMVQRSIPIRKPKTSSFPSRAVCCGVVYVFVVVYAYLYYVNEVMKIEWLWMSLLFIVVILGSTFARVYLGAHYPSDCLFGAVEGILICAIGTVIWELDALGCTSCKDGKCYSPSGSDTQLTYRNLVDMSLWPFVAVVGASLIVTVLAVMKPIHFWRKCDRALGLLLPCAAFQVGFLCPNGSETGCSLAAPEMPPPYWAYLFAIGVPVILLIIPTVLKSKNYTLNFMILYSLTLGLLVTWRLFVLPM